MTAVVIQVSRQQAIDIAGRPRYATHRLVVLALVVERRGHLFRHVVEALGHEFRRRLLVITIVLRRGAMQHRVTTALVRAAKIDFIRLGQCYDHILQIFVRY